MNTLSDLAKSHVLKSVKIVDSALATYIKEAIAHIERRGERLEDYSLVQVSNPMEHTDSGIRVTMQWRLVKTSELQNLPTYEEEL